MVNLAEYWPKLHILLHIVEPLQQVHERVAAN